MTVCKFFQQGNCRYGQNCRFDHIYDRSKYIYHAPSTQAVNQPSGVTDEQLVNQVQTDVQSALGGGQWILSCYSPFKEKPNFPGITDLSTEEARLFIYEAKSNNNLDQAVNYMNNLFKDYRHKYEQLLQPNTAIIKVLRSLYKGEIVQSPFDNRGDTQGFENNTSASSVFRSAVQTASVFGQNTANTPSIFGQSQAPSNASGFGQPNVFGPSSPSTVFDQKSSNVFASSNTANAAKSIFAQASQNIFGPSQTNQNIFASSNQPTNVFAAANNQSADAGPKSIFAQASQNAFGANQSQNVANVFSNASQSGFGESVFSQQQTTPFSNQQNSSPFFNPSQNVFQTTAGGHSEDRNIYSDINDLSPSDLEAFKADDFKLGFIPEVPPPHSLCF